MEPTRYRAWLTTDVRRGGGACANAAIQWVLIAVIALIIASMAVKWIVFPGREFDAVMLSTHAKTGDGTRQAMADRLIVRGTLIGLRCEEIVARLSMLPATEYFTDWDIVYWLGPERGFMCIDSE